MCLVCYSVVLMGRETGSLQLLAPLLLTGGKGADLVIRGNVVLNREQRPRRKVAVVWPSGLGVPIFPQGQKRLRAGDRPKLVLC
jgi:hypothetical protein